MNWLYQRVAAAFSRVVLTFSAVKDRVTDKLPGSAQDVMNVIDHIAAGVVASIFFAMIGRFLPFYGTPAVLLIVAVAGFKFGQDFKIGIITFLGLSTFYFMLTQPAIVLFACGLIGLATGGYAGWSLRESPLKAALAAVVGILAGTAITTALYYLVGPVVLPLLHPLTLRLYGISPLVADGLIVATVAYTTFRQPVDRASWYWVATPVLATVFCAYFWPTHSIAAMVVAVAVGGALSLLAFGSRPTRTRPGRALTGLASTAIAGGLFALLFWASNASTTIYRYQMANALDVQYADKVGETVNNRLVPLLAASDYCAQNNFDQNTKLDNQPSPILMPDAKTGEERFYWQCIRYPLNYKGRPLDYFTGGMDGAVLADAGERGNFGTAIDVEFLIGKQSVFLTSAFDARHPGSEMLTGMIAPSKSGAVYFLVPYKSKVMQWGAMLPDVSGVMVVSPWGFIEDYTTQQAAEKFPGVSLIPSELARQYAELWAQESSVWASHFSGNTYEVADLGSAKENQYPFWQDFKQEGLKTGVLKGFIPFEPAGAQQNGLAFVGLFDRASLKMTVVDERSQKLPSPRWIVNNVANTHPGMYNVSTIDALITVPESGRIYYLTSLVQPSQTVNHGYSFNVLNRDRGQAPHWDVGSTAELDKALAEAEALEAQPVTPEK